MSNITDPFLTLGRTTIIRAKLKNSDDQTNIYKFRVAANITEYYLAQQI